MAKKRRREAIFIPNQAAKNPAGMWRMFSDNAEDYKQRDLEHKRRMKQALKNK